MVEGVMDRYLMKMGDEPYKEVTQEQFVRAERNAGFRPKGGGGGPATGGFSSGVISATVVYAREGERREEFDARVYQRAHPEVDWDTHEVLYRWNGADKPMTVESHWLKPDYEALQAEMDRLDRLEQLLFQNPDTIADQVVLRVEWLKILLTSHSQLLALQSHGVDGWDGYAAAMEDWRVNG